MNVPPITIEEVRRIELLCCRAAESLMRPIAEIPHNGQGYGFFERGPVRATLSTNPYAGWANGAFGMGQADDETLDATINFFLSHNVSPVVRVVPDGFDAKESARLAKHGLRQTGFHTVMWSPLPTEVAAIPENIRVQLVTDASEF